MIEHINFAKEMQVPLSCSSRKWRYSSTFPGNKPKVLIKLQLGRMFVDGNISVGEESQSIKDRKNLSYNGFLEITIIVNRYWFYNKKPIISFRGIPSNGENTNFIFDLEDKIRRYM